jgi:hypothetical protein
MVPAESASCRVQIMVGVIAVGDASRGLALLVARLPPAQFFGGMPLVAAQLGDQRDHPGVDADHQPSGFLAPVVAHQHPAGAAGRIGHVGTPLIEHEFQASAQPVPAILERRDARVAAADFERDRARGGFLECANPCANLRED